MNRNSWLAKRILGLSEIVVIGALLGSFAALFGKYHFLLDLCTHFRLQAIGGLLVCGFLVTLLSKRRWFGILAMVTGLGLLLTLAPYFPRKSTDPGNAGFRVMSFNVLTSNESKEAVADYILSEAADVVVLLEIDANWSVAMQKRLSGDYPHSIQRTRADNFGIAAFSKRPFQSAEIIHPGPDQLPSVDLRFQNLRLIGTHPLPPMNAEHWRSRNHQFEALADLIKPDEPTIVCGDFNSGPWSPYLKGFLEEAALVDSAVGKGISPTWYGMFNLVGLPIDHIFLSEELAVERRKIGPYLGSDHRPVTVDFRFSKPALD
ncbi:MAG: endonuclease/exonuclease/phosphatase family protein [Verrucomicrobiales bacterium]|nr:endonuclease/exonuclease/phosphatase family protein [Verrucomicrobiales bacterium]